MTLKIEKVVSGKTAIVRLIGRLSVEHFGEVWKEIKFVEVPMTLDLSELSLVSLEGVRFLNAWEDKGIAVTNALPHISACMLRERERRASTHDGQCNSFGLAGGSGPGESLETRV